MAYDESYAAFQAKVNAFKDDVLGPVLDGPPICLHRKDIIEKSGPFYVLQDKAIEDRFNTGLLELLAEAPIKICCVIIDKKAHREKYQAPNHPYHYCLDVMLERYCGWLNMMNAVGDVMAEARGKTEDQQLKGAYQRFHQNGTWFFKPQTAQRVLTTKDLKLKGKTCNIVGLQIADILAQPIKQRLLFENGHVAVQAKGFGLEVYKAVEAKLNCQMYTGKVQGYGWVILP